MPKKTKCIIFAIIFLIGAYIGRVFDMPFIIGSCFIAFTLMAFATLILEFKEDPRWPHKPKEEK
jgi:hypothetical protein